jgi:hypothetical protein
VRRRDLRGTGDDARLALCEAGVVPALAALLHKSAAVARAAALALSLLTNGRAWQSSADAFVLLTGVNSLRV